MPPPRSSFAVFPDSSNHLFIVQLIDFNAIMITLKHNDERSKNLTTEAAPIVR